VRVAIVGLGLIGGSAGIAWREAGHTVLGYARRPETRRLALELGAADETPPSLAGAAQAEVVVLAPPVLAVRDLLARLAPHLTPGTVVTDVASTKRCVETWAGQLLPPGVAYIGGHPMAGKEQAGIEHADGRLFQGRTWCIVPPPGADPGAEAVVRRLAQDAGSHPLRLEAEEHDRAVAATSHLPFLASALLAQTVVARPEFPHLAPVAGSGLRDTTRLASGDPLMHRDICLTNRDFLVLELQRYAAHLAAVTDLLRRLPDPDDLPDVPDAPLEGGGPLGDPLGDLGRTFVELKRARDAWLEG
jgi:prephenate dehydrogenase